MNTLTYTRKDVVRRTAEKLNIGDKELKVILDMVLETMTDMFKEPQGNLRLEMRNFGVFEIKPTKAKPKARNPRTNEEIYVPPHRKIHFKPGKPLKDVLRKEWVPGS